MRREQLIAFRQLGQAGEDVPSAIVTAVDQRGRAIRVMLGDALGAFLEEAMAAHRPIRIAPGMVAGTLH